MNEEKDNTLKWRFDISTFRLIGRDLITDRITALFELVKNSYDANANTVTITFHNVGLNQKDSYISIVDDGYGMSFEDIENKWMVIGTSSKREKPYSPKPYYRKCVGEKGIGRFAVDKLGSKLRMKSKKCNQEFWTDVEIDWNKYDTLKTDEQGIHLFTDIENKYTIVHADNSLECGTHLIISDIREVWTKSDIERFMSEVSRIVSPFHNLKYPFDVKIIAEEYCINSKAIRTTDDLDIATLSFSLDFNIEAQLQETVYFDKSTSKLGKRNIPIKSFGGIKMVVYFFDDKARRRYRKEYKDYPIDGIKIYRDNIITTPFAENEQDPDKKRDILGIDKRLWQDIFNRVSTREIIGFVDITYDGNPKIIDATNRQDFVDNVEYRDLKDFIILQLNAIQDYKIYIRQTKKKEDQNGYNQATDELDNLIETVSKMASDNPSLQKNITPVIHQVKKTKSTVQKAFQEHKKAEEEFARKENMFMSIMSLQDYAIHITHAVRTTVNKIREEAEYFSLFYPNEKYESMFLLYSKKMFNELTLLNKVVDYMLSYSKSNLQLNDMDFGEMVDEVLNSYNTILNNQQVRVQREFQLPAHLILHTNKMFFRDILQNLIDNSIKALQHSKIKLIKLTAFIKDKELVLLFSDTGVGVPIEKREWVFGLYNTTTEDQGGGGIGLYIVKTRMEALQGSVSVINSEFGIIGTTLELKIPFKN